LEHLEMLAGLPAGFAQFAKEQVPGFARIVGQLESEIVRRGPDLALEDREVLDVGLKRNGLTPSAASGGTSP
jgi:hypothetical protein